MIEILAEILSRLRPLIMVRWLAVVAGCLLLWIVINYEPLREYFAMRDNVEANRETNARLERQRNDLMKENEALQAGGFPAEKAIRERLLMIKPGEKVYMIQTTPTTNTTETNAN
ncbi:septum formation initiator family protein [bacterium]|nr:septum formation initiator family protein [bacterium]